MKSTGERIKFKVMSNLNFVYFFLDLLKLTWLTLLNVQDRQCLNSMCMVLVPKEKGVPVRKARLI